VRILNQRWTLVLKELTMSKICFGMLMMVTVLAGASVADEPAPGMGYGVAAPGMTDIRPSGLRFTGSDLSVRTGNIEGMQGPGDCQACGHLYCGDWKLSPWFASWDEPHSQGCGQGHCGCSTCGQ
jgi:hypothetical protein